MFGNFQEAFSSSDVNPAELERAKQHINLDLPSIEGLKSKLESILGFIPHEGTDRQLEASVENLLDNKDAGTVVLDDGTVITLPDKLVPKQEIRSSVSQSNSDVYQTDVKFTRELTEDEKNGLKETLGWTDKQISKCMIDEDDIIHYRTDREDMEGKAGENGIQYERKTVDIHDVKVQGVFPVFDSVCDVHLPEDLEKASNARQFRECNTQLKEKVYNNPELRDTFTDEQLEEIEDGDTPSGYVWHHNEETGKMQLVKIEDHDRTQGGAAHTGGKALWGGGYSNHETSK